MEIVLTPDSQRRITFVHTPKVYYEQTYGARFLPVWIYALAAYVPPEWEVGAYDCTLTKPSQIPASAVFAFSGINQDFHAIRSVHDYLRRKYPDAVFVLGGPITWSYDKAGKLADLQYFDHVFIGDGEEALPAFLNNLTQGNGDCVERVIRYRRFPVRNARKLEFNLFQQHATAYYGGVVEVSRGCPFLCEFCDIRVIADNNEAHNKDVSLVVAELDEYYKRGIRRVQLACDNFIGDPAWASECVDAILAWTEATGAQMALYTWLTINVSKMPDLLLRMRKAGFTSLFIGVESFNANSILETAKVQNRNDRHQLVPALQFIQSFGFIVMPGLIFGFDSDGPQMFADMLSGIAEAGLIGGDATFLLALPGTPLFSRMKRTNRLIEDDQSETSVPLYSERVAKIESNIRYLQPNDVLVDGFMKFIEDLNRPQFAYERFEKHVAIMMEGKNFCSAHSVAYGGVAEYLKFQCSTPANAMLLFNRLALLLKPARLVVVAKAMRLVLRYRSRYRGLSNHLMVWAFMWTNSLMKYSRLRREDFKIHSIPEDYELGAMWRDMEFVDPEVLPNGRNAENIKVAAQARSTREAIWRLKETFEASPDLSQFWKQ